MKDKYLDCDIRDLPEFLRGASKVEKEDEDMELRPNERIISEDEAKIMGKFQNTGSNTQSFVDVKKKVLECTEFEDRVYDVLNEINSMLVNKNKKYGNSALEPKRIFSKADAIEQINVRIDDKLSRIANQNVNDDEDAELDLIGYLILKRIAKDIK